MKVVLIDDWSEDGSMLVVSFGDTQTGDAQSAKTCCEDGCCCECANRCDVRCRCGSGRCCDDGCRCQDGCCCEEGSQPS